MSRPRRPSEHDLTFHVTARCNDRKFHLSAARIAGLYRAILSRYRVKHGFTVYAYAIITLNFLMPDSC